MRKTIRLICMILAFSFLLAFPVSAQTGNENRASMFFSAHNTFLSKVSENRFKICYDVTAVGIMDKLGVCEIELDRSPDGTNWELIATYEKTFYPVMVASNTASHSGYITYYTATPGYYYRAYVTFYAKDSRGTGKLSRMTATLHM